MSLSTFAAGPEIQNVSKGNLERVANEFAVNFSHTVVAAPETEGVWGVEVGLVAGRTNSPALSDVVDEAGEDGGNFRSIYHAGLMSRVHFPFDLFAEIAVLPSREISDVDVESKSGSIGWNAGGFFGLPLDLAIGLSASNAEVSFDQAITSAGVSVDSNITLEGQSRLLWIAASKRFAFFTPYVKAGFARTESKVKVKAAGGIDIFAFSNNQTETVDSTGAYMVLGANAQLFFMRLGLEFSRTIGVNKISGKLSVDF